MNRSLHIYYIKSFLVAAILVIACIPSAKAQTDGNLSQYYAAPTLYNPGAAGTTEFLRIRGGSRLQWLGIENAPKTFVAAGDMPFKFIEKRFGVGLLLNNQSEGLYKSFDIAAQLSFKFKKFGGEFSGGLQVGVYDQSFKGSEVFIPDDDDYHESADNAIPTSDIHGTALDLAAGVWFEHKKFYAGVSCTHINSPTIKMNAQNGGGDSSTERNYEFTARRTLYFTGGCNIPIKNTLFELIPSVLVKSDLTFTTGELTARCRYNKFLSFGLGYRWDDAVIASVAAEIKNFYIGYSYDYATGAIMKASSGSHEIFVGYSMKVDLSDKNRNRHKSIRIM